ncbi:histone-lysine N-methyltransferase SETMAR-like [Ptiloglossa arizonensis]|uniref:histone-lysine N-methyltransferase SETMAR-like n=1 Tax=Ptiloglossa arizonensis TaxID=3350558 RepID=UPI003F9EDF07
MCSTTTDTVKNICKVYDERALNLRKCQRWFSEFRKGDFDLSDEPRSGRPTAFNPEALKTLIEFKPQLTTDEIAERLDTSRSTVHRHLIQLGKVSKLGKWVSDHYYCNPKRKRQWLSPGGSSLQWPKPVLRPRKVLSRVCWDIRGIIHFELLKQNQTVTAEIYSQQLERDTQKNNGRKTKNFNWELPLHPPYSSDLAPSDYHLFGSMQHFLSGRNFNNSEDVKSALNEYFHSKSQKCFENRIRKLTETDDQYIKSKAYQVQKSGQLCPPTYGTECRHRDAVYALLQIGQCLLAIGGKTGTIETITVISRSW